MREGAEVSVGETAEFSISPSYDAVKVTAIWHRGQVTPQMDANTCSAVRYNVPERPDASLILTLLLLELPNL